MNNHEFSNPHDLTPAVIETVSRLSQILPCMTFVCRHEPGIEEGKQVHIQTEGTSIDILEATQGVCVRLYREHSDGEAHWVDFGPYSAGSAVELIKLAVQ